MAGYVHSFESLAAVDGEGVRCAVFLAGCPLRCVYCHNPDTWSADRAKEMDGAVLAAKLCRYRPYFGDRGGVTFSGGEPLLQAEFLSQLIPILREEKISYAVDTSGIVPLTESVRFVLSNASQILLDLKFWDDASYVQYTGQSWESLWKTLDFLEEQKKSVTLRTVVIPRINDSKEILSRYLKAIKGYTCVRKYELLPFHTLGFFKYESLEIENPLASVAPLSDEICMELQKFIDDTFLSTV